MSSMRTRYPNARIQDDEIVDDEMEMEFLRERFQEDNRNYEVFLSFRGEDTRASFTSHLYTALQNAGIFVFKDDESLPRGKHISPSLRLAIEESRISVVVFSRNYAESRWCLKELEKIMECHRTTGHVVVPVFYDVDPFEVRYQTGQFGKGFQNLLNKILKEEGEKLLLLEWREALREAAGISRRAVLNSSDEMEIDFYVKYWRKGLCKAAGIPLVVDLCFSGEIEIADEIDLLVKQWRKALYETAGISGVAVLNPSVEMEMANNEIDQLVKRWREALHETAGIVRFVVLNSSGKLDNEINLLAKRWTEGLREAAGIPEVVVLNSGNESEAIKNIVENITRLLDQTETELFIADNPMGVEPRQQLPFMSSMSASFSTSVIKDDEIVDEAIRISCSDGDDEMEMDFLRELYQDNRHYEVFLSFRGEDTRASFTSHLYNSFQNAGIVVFKDDESLPRGNQISPSLRLAIEESRISVVVFSRNYAESRWCLKELEKIMECHRTTGHVVVPVFYDVDPSEVRHQTGHFGKGFQNLLNKILKEEEEKVQLDWREELREEMESAKETDIYTKYWRKGLCKAAGIPGVVVLNSSGEMEIVNEIDLHVKHWREALCKAAGISAFNSSEVVMEMANNEIDLLVKHLREALHEAAAAGISRFVVLNSRKMDNEIKVLVKRWTEALREAAGIAGVVVLNSRNESEAIKNIVENVTRLLDKTEMFVADNPVGVEPRVQEMIQLLDQKSTNDVLLLGIWGMGGIGKTTIAKAIYNKIGCNFEGRSFLAHIREVWGQDAGQVYLQEQLLFDIDKETNTKIRNVESGKNILKERLRHKKVLLILDDVNKLHQLNVLCGSREWFGSGSRIIITTRDLHILRGRRVDKVYTMKGMNEDESIEFFSWNAFKQASPREDFTELSRNVIAYSGGLPLALEVLGSYLFDMEVTEWKNVLEKLKKIPNDEVQEKLKISYDGLSDDTEKGIFLDIACFFIGMDRNDVIHILNGCGLFAENGIRVLVERSLVIVDDKNKLGMHDLLRDMGREIIRSKSPMELEERSRLWFHEDVLDVISKETGTKAIEGLALKLPRTNTKCLSTKAFEKMKKLRLLQLAGVELVGDFQHLSRDLRWLCWHGFPFACIPTNFHQGSLVSIELENSKITIMWKHAQMMEMLKILNLSHSHYLTQTPNFSNLPNLEKLVLIDCPRLSKVSYTIGHLNKVLLINFQDCISLRNLPRSIYKLKSLKTLILSGCLKIDKLEEDFEQMESLTTLVADKTAITRVPFSIVRSKSIGYISLCGYEGFSRDVFPSIIWSWMSPTNGLSSHLQTFVGTSSLVSLDVPNSSSNHLPYIYEDLPKLQSLWIECESELQLSRDATSILDALYAIHSEELESTATTSQMHNINAFTLIECNNQVHNPGSKNSFRSLLIQMGMSYQITHILKQRILQNMTTSDGNGCLLPGDSFPDWLTFNSEGSSVTFEIPQVNGRNLKTMMCHIHYSSPNNVTSDGLKNLLVINHTKTTIQLYKRNALASFEEEEWQRVLSKIEPGNKVQIVVIFWSRLTINKTTIYLIYEPMNEKMEHAPNKKVITSSGDENVCVVRSITSQEESMDDLRYVSEKSLIKRLLNKFLSCKEKSKKKKNQG